MAQQKTILVAPLHWGLGHATRCIPIIRSLLEHRYKVILASDGGALSLLQQEFTELESIELPSYNIEYPTKGSHFKWKLLRKIPHIRRTIASEKSVIKKLVAEGGIDGIISDSRLGVRNKNIPSVFITHQLNVLSGNTTQISSWMHQKEWQKFDACWVPDMAGKRNLSGLLGHPEKIDCAVTYIGPLSRMRPILVEKKHDILVLLSGPEPQRTMLENKLISELKESSKKIVLVQGKMAAEQKSTQCKSITIINFMLTKELESAVNSADLVIARSGYTTIMDLATLEKKAFFIPTPGQYEQQYLAKRLRDQGIAPSCQQQEFSEEKLQNLNNYKGFESVSTTQNFEELFRFF